jgi:hypothetical protein
MTNSPKWSKTEVSDPDTGNWRIQIHNVVTVNIKRGKLIIINHMYRNKLKDQL